MQVSTRRQSVEILNSGWSAYVALGPIALCPGVAASQVIPNSCELPDYVNL